MKKPKVIEAVPFEDPPLPARRGCLSPRHSVGRLLWLSALSGASFAATVWPGKLGGWYFHFAVLIWIMTAIVWGFWISIAVQTVWMFRKMKRELDRKWTEMGPRP
ncbi:MAG: hypothetical protein K8T20_19190 [Planctomycetes bacterium]|nr:hypothetical protein [Planctomycetota bacterium]